jgi:hypothetical protein
MSTEARYEDQRSEVEDVGARSRGPVTHLRSKTSAAKWRSNGRAFKASEDGGDEIRGRGQRSEDGGRPRDPVAFCDLGRS